MAALHIGLELFVLFDQLHESLALFEHRSIVRQLVLVEVQWLTVVDGIL